MAEPNLPNHRATGLLVDYGGVLTTSIHTSFATFCEREQLDVHRFRSTLGAAFADASSPAARVETGAIDTTTFDEELARLLSEGIGAPVSADRLVERLFAEVRREPVMVEAIRRIRASGVTTVLVSNSWGGAAYEDEVMELLFDHHVISGKVGLRKPDRAIYEHALSLGGLEAASCVFIDDLALNCQGAEALGIAAIHHIEPHASIATLAERFQVDLSDLVPAR